MEKLEELLDEIGLKEEEGEELKRAGEEMVLALERALLLLLWGYERVEEAWYHAWEVPGFLQVLQEVVRRAERRALKAGVKVEAGGPLDGLRVNGERLACREEVLRSIALRLVRGAGYDPATVLGVAQALERAAVSLELAPEVTRRALRRKARRILAQEEALRKLRLRADLRRNEGL